MTTRSTKYPHCGLLTPLGPTYFNTLINDRQSLLERTQDLPDVEFYQLLEEIDLVDTPFIYYSEYYQRNLTLAEVLSIYSVGIVEDMLDQLEDSMTPPALNIEQFTRVFQQRELVWQFKLLLIRLDLGEEYERSKVHSGINYDELARGLVQGFEQHEATQRHRKLDAARKRPRITHLRAVLQEIVITYYKTHGKRIPKEKCLSIIKREYCGEGGLIASEDDIDYEEEKITCCFRPFATNGPPNKTKTIKFKSLNNQISKTYKKITS